MKASWSWRIRRVPARASIPIEGLKDYLRADPDPGFIVWTSLRKAQIADQDGLSFIPLHGRHAGNCRKLPEAQELGRKGYPIRDVLCTRRCPHLARCTYMRQFDQEGDFFAAMPLAASDALVA